MHARFRSVSRIPGPVWVNDTHSALNRTAVNRVVEAHRVDDVVDTVMRARMHGEALAIATNAAVATQ